MSSSTIISNNGARISRIADKDGYAICSNCTRVIHSGQTARKDETKLLSHQGCQQAKWRIIKREQRTAIEARKLAAEGISIAEVVKQLDRTTTVVRRCLKK